MERTLPRPFVIPNARWSVLALAPVLLLIRRPEELLRPDFAWEEAAAFYVPAFSGPGIFDSWAGYLNVVPRAAFALSPWLPPEIAPLVPTFVAFGVVLGVAGFVASDRVPVPWIVGPLILLLPATRDLHGSALNANWYLAIYLVGLSVARKHWSDYPGAVLASLSGPASVFLLPLFWRRRDLLPIVAVCAAIQVAVILSVARPANAEAFDPAAFVYHVGVVPLLGERVSLLVPWFVGIGTLALGAYLVVKQEAFRARDVQHHERVDVGGHSVLHWLYAAAVMAVSGSVLSGVYMDPVAGERYYLLVAVAFAVIITMSTSPLRWVLASLLAVGMLGDFRLPATPDMGWPPDCIGQEGCYLPMHPPEWSVTWGDPVPKVP